MRVWSWLYKFGSPKYCYQVATKILPLSGILFVSLLTWGVVQGLFFAPPDYQQGDAYRIMYVHVPSAALSLVVYFLMAVQALMFLVWRIKMCDVFLKAAAPIGAWFTVLALITGSLWGKPMWGTWWVWDARLTSELILLFLYLGVILLRQSISSVDRAAKACAMVVLIGVIDLPIIHYSVYWWHSLHQGSTVLGFHKPELVNSMLTPLLVMFGAFIFYFIVVFSLRVRQEILHREHRSQWIQQLLGIHHV